MDQLFQYVTCILNKPVRLACLTQECQLSPFVCSQNCLCYQQHKSTCNIKAIEQLTKSMMRVLQFQFLVIYSPILKGSSISVMGRYAQQTFPRSKNQQFALTFDPILKNNAVNEISFRLKKIKACVGVGLFIRQILISNNFKYLPDDKYLSHGGYMLLSNNYLFSSSFEEQNCIESNKMDLKQSNIVHLRIINDQKGHKIEFKEDNTGRKQYLSLNWKDQLTYHFGVYLYDEGDSAQILNKKI